MRTAILASALILAESINNNFPSGFSQGFMIVSSMAFCVINDLISQSKKD